MWFGLGDFLISKVDGQFMTHESIADITIKSNPFAST